MAVSRDEVLHVARLARLRIADADVGRFTHQLNDILRHVEALTDAEAGPGPDAQAPVRGAPLRVDEPDADALERSPETLAAAWADGFFILPRLPALDADAAEAQATDTAP